MEVKPEILPFNPLYVFWFALGYIAFITCYISTGFHWNFFINGAIEFGGSVFLLKNVFQMAKDKMLRGYHWHATVFFMTWGFWNIYYYPSVGDWYSFTGGLFIVSVNTFWLGQVWYYRKN